MTSRSEPFSDRFLAMSEDEQMNYLRDSAVTDDAELSPEVKSRFDEMLSEARERMNADVV